MKSLSAYKLKISGLILWHNTKTEICINVNSMDLFIRPKAPDASVLNLV